MTRFAKLSIVVACSLLMSVAWWMRSMLPVDSASKPIVVRSTPLRLVSSSFKTVHDPRDLLLACDSLCLPSSPQWPELIHALRLWGRSPFGGDSGWTGDQTLRMVLDSEEMEQYFDGGLFHQMTDHGVMFRTLSRGELGTMRRPADPHPNKTLSVMATLGVPAAEVIRVHGNVSSVADAVRNCAWNFTLDEEVSWSTIALALYLPPERSWINKFGERVSFTDVCRYLHGVEAGRGSCYGTHLYFALAVLLNIDSTEPILSDRVRREAIARLQMLADMLRRNQLADGGWSATWWKAERPSALAQPSRAEMVTVTGHTLEWLAICPAIHVDMEMVWRACRFLSDALLEESPANKEARFGMWTHAVNGIRLSFPERSLGKQDRADGIEFAR